MLCHFGRFKSTFRRHLICLFCSERQPGVAHRRKEETDEGGRVFLCLFVSEGLSELVGNAFFGVRAKQWKGAGGSNVSAESPESWRLSGFSLWLLSLLFPLCFSLLLSLCYCCSVLLGSLTSSLSRYLQSISHFSLFTFLRHSFLLFSPSFPFSLCFASSSAI